MVVKCSTWEHLLYSFHLQHTLNELIYFVKRNSENWDLGEMPEMYNIIYYFSFKKQTKNPTTTTTKNQFVCPTITSIGVQDHRYY
jgi:hypothetical protein